LFVLVALSHYSQQPQAPTIKVPANELYIVKLHAITTAKSKIHIATDCKAEVHDVHGNVITELPANFKGTLHLHLNCSKSSPISIWLDHGAIWFYE